MYDVATMVAEIWSGVLDPIYGFLRSICIILGIVLAVSLGGFLVKTLPAVGHLLKSKEKDVNAIADGLSKVRFRLMPYDLIRWLIVDYLRKIGRKGIFDEYGITFYVGRQGGGKTTSMVRYMRLIKAEYPKVIIVSNIETRFTDVLMTSWQDFMTIRNGTDGVLFAIDEIQAEYSARTSKDFPDALLRQICMQRKQRIKIVCTAQYFSRVAKPLREQANDVVVCSTFLGRLVTLKAYDAVIYEAFSGGLPIKMEKKQRLWRERYVMADSLRSSFDTFAMVQKLGDLDYKERICNDYWR